VKSLRYTWLFNLAAGLRGWTGVSIRFFKQGVINVLIGEKNMMRDENTLKISLKHQINLVKTPFFA
jgi:hypothetical protein